MFGVDLGSWMATLMNFPKNVYILGKYASYGQIWCHLARHKQLDTNVKRLMVKLKHHQLISKSMSPPKVMKLSMPSTKHNFGIDLRMSIL